MALVFTVLLLLYGRLNKKIVTSGRVLHCTTLYYFVLLCTTLYYFVLLCFLDQQYDHQLKIDCQLKHIYAFMRFNRLPYSGFLASQDYMCTVSLKLTTISFVDNFLKHVVTENSCLAHKILEKKLKDRFCNCINKIKCCLRRQLLSNNILYQVIISAT